MIKKIALITTLLAMLVTPLTLSTTTAVLAVDCKPTSGSTANIQDSLNCGTCLDVTNDNKCVTEDPEKKVNQTIALIINIFSVVVGVVAVIMVIVGGFKYITSNGDSGNVSGAKNTILYAVIGLVVVALAQFIVRFVLNRATAV
jgi:hypothetical protein